MQWGDDMDRATDKDLLAVAIREAERIGSRWPRRWVAKHAGLSAKDAVPNGVAFNEYRRHRMRIESLLPAHKKKECEELINGL